jgi:hypothetical protein
LLLLFGKVCNIPCPHVDIAERSIGPQTKVMRKAKMSFQSGQVKQVIRTYAVEIQTGDKKDLDEEAVTMKLRKAMGANCEYTFCYLC